MTGKNIDLKPPCYFSNVDFETDIAQIKKKNESIFEYLAFQLPEYNYWHSYNREYDSIWVSGPSGEKIFRSYEWLLRSDFGLKASGQFKLSEDEITKKVFENLPDISEKLNKNIRLSLPNQKIVSKLRAKLEQENMALIFKEARKTMDKLPLVTPIDWYLKKINASDRIKVQNKAKEMIEIIGKELPEISAYLNARVIELKSARRCIGLLNLKGFESKIEKAFSAEYFCFLFIPEMRNKYPFGEIYFKHLPGDRRNDITDLETNLAEQKTNQG
jgi:hypothetical protein